MVHCPRRSQLKLSFLGRTFGVGVAELKTSASVELRFDRVRVDKKVLSEIDQCEDDAGFAFSVRCPRISSTRELIFTRCCVPL